MMRNALFFCAVLIFALGTATAFAATDVTGDWTATMSGPNGEMQLTFHFKQDGDKLTGDVGSPMGGDPMEISNGKVDGNKISFEVSFNGNTISHEGTVNGDEIKLSAKPEGGQNPESMEMTLKRAK